MLHAGVRKGVESFDSVKKKSGFFFLGGELLLLMNARKGIVGSFLCWSPERRLPAAMPNCVSSSSSFLFPPSSSSIFVSRKSGREMEGGGGNEGRHAIERAIYLPPPPSSPPVFPGKICGRSAEEEGVIVAKFTGRLRARA